MTTPRNHGRVSAPDAAVGWLDTIREYSDIDDYVRATLGSEPRNSELNMLRRVVFGDVISRGPSGSDLALERGRTWADTLYRRALVLQIELDAETLLRTKGPLVVLLAMPPISFGPTSRARGSRQAKDLFEARVDRWRSAALEVHAVFRIEDVARRRLERRYLKGHPALFSGTAERWKAARNLAEWAREEAALSGDPPARSAADWATERSTFQAAVAARIGDLEELARVQALRMVGENERADGLELARFLRSAPSRATDGTP